eukprot:TRINITY_DN3204_c1_g5_i1.p1 TRINITY_DN3204_c1_g5~~TRINITY_DN3204_c1_g5_i1.p1  ORF type:complete len:640 (+),score=171.45 TRINITY_DN3204_c1_g5_i1:44-1921(+)
MTEPIFKIGCEGISLQERLGDSEFRFLGNTRIVIPPNMKRWILSLIPIVLWPLIIVIRGFYLAPINNENVFIFLWNNRTISCIVCIFSYFATIYFFFRSSLTEPGIIPKQYIDDLKHFEKPRWFFEFKFDGKSEIVQRCPSCRTYRFPRSSHGFGSCIQRFDHICPWLGTIIGIRNYYFFNAFNISLTAFLICIYWLLSSYLGFMGFVPFDFDVKYLFEVINCILLLGVLWFPVALLFFHLFLCYSGQTTREFLKDIPGEKSIGNLLNIFKLSVPTSLLFEDNCGPIIEPVFPKKVAEITKKDVNELKETNIFTDIESYVFGDRFDDSTTIDPSENVKIIEDGSQKDLSTKNIFDEDIGNDDECDDEDELQDDIPLNIIISSKPIIDEFPSKVHEITVREYEHIDFHQAIFKGDLKLIEDYIIRGFNVNEKNQGETSLYQAIFYGYFDLVELILDHGADVNLCNDNGTSPLYISCQEGHIEVAKMLLDHGADVNLCNDSGTSPLYISCQEGHIEVAKMLLDHGADISLCNNKGASPLYVSCYFGHLDVANMLLDSGADVNLCNEEGYSSLFISCQEGHLDIVKMLLEYGADKSCCDMDEDLLFSDGCKTDVLGDNEKIELSIDFN